jgi:hydrogenase/urease accessory protein HupE
VTKWSCRWLAGAVFALALILLPATAFAHEVESASLSLREVASGRFAIRWQSTSPTLQADLAASAVFPKPCRLEGAYLDCGAGGLVGSLEFPWLEGTLSRVLVDVEWQNGQRLQRMLTPSSPALAVYGIPSGSVRFLAPIIVDYTRLGVEHILLGFDHLMFVVALVLLVPNRRRLVATVTAFTLAHSITLAATVLDLVRIPITPVEAVIALSIVLVCAECLRPQDSLARRAPWAVSFGFGLLHGLGFASALLELGVPEAHVPAALVCFNLGVELGQLAVVVALLASRQLALRFRLEARWLRPSVIYAIGGIAAFWSLDRITRMLLGG